MYRYSNEFLPKKKNVIYIIYTGAWPPPLNVLKIGANVPVPPLKYGPVYIYKHKTVCQENKNKLGNSLCV